MPNQTAATTAPRRAIRANVFGRVQICGSRGELVERCLNLFAFLTMFVWT